MSRIDCSLNMFCISLNMIDTLHELHHHNKYLDNRILKLWDLDFDLVNCM